MKSPEINLTQPAAARRWRRYHFDLPVRLTVNNADIGVSVRGTELNEGGIAICTPTELKIGDRLQLEFTPPYSGLPITLPAVVRNNSDNRYGLEFTGSNPAEQQEIALLRLFVRSLSGQLDG
jgi:hypothetical protein